MAGRPVMNTGIVAPAWECRTGEPFQPECLRLRVVSSLVQGKLHTSHNVRALPASRVWLFHVSNLTACPTLDINYFQMETLPSAAQRNWRQCWT